MSRLRDTVKEWASSIAFALLLTQFGASAVVVDGASMMPNLRDGELIVVPKLEGWAWRLGAGEYHSGDIVVFKPPREAAYEWKNDYKGVPLPWKYRPYLVKRVVAVAGDQVQISAGDVYVNGELLPEPTLKPFWASHCRDVASPVANTPVFTVPAGHYFAMGDNRSLQGSLDSRSFGPVAASDIAGRAVASVWPLQAKAEATPPCDHRARPQDHIQYSGETRFNPRSLIP